MKTFFIVLVLMSLLTNSYGQNTKRIVGVLNPKVSSYALFVNNKSIHTIKNEEQFYYFPDNEYVLTTNKKGGKLPIDLFQAVDSLKFIKFKFTQKDLSIEDFHEDLILAESLGLEYRILVDEAINSQGEALIQLLSIDDHVDGGAAEAFPERYFMILHFWSDEDLAVVIKKDKTNYRQKLLQFLLNEFYTGFTNNEIEEYMGLFYPKTWHVLKN